eukprot:tig00020934_g16071.t1
MQLSKDGRQALAVWQDDGFYDAEVFLTLLDVDRWAVLSQIACPDGTAGVFVNDALGEGERNFDGPRFQLSEDCTRAVTANKDNTVSVWDFASRAELHRLTGQECGSRAVAWLPGGAQVVSLAEEEFRVWPLTASAHSVNEARAHRSVAHGGEQLRMLRLSQDGSRLRLGTGQRARLWDLSNGLCIDEARADCRFAVDGSVRAVRPTCGSERT